MRAVFVVNDFFFDPGCGKDCEYQRGEDTCWDKQIASPKSCHRFTLREQDQSRKISETGMAKPGSTSEVNWSSRISWRI